MKKRLIAIVLAIATLVSLFTVSAGAATTTTTNKGLGEIGKIVVKNTKINYPIVVATNNSWYLDKNTKGKKDVNGSIFMDYRNRDLSRRRNIILYGHNMKSGKMFANLHNFEKQDFFNKNSSITLELFGRKYDYEIILVAQFDTTKFNHTRTQFANDAEFKQFLTDAVANAKYVRSGYTPAGTEDILTLSTCVSHSIKNYKNYKCVVMARRTKDNGLVNALPVTK